MCKNWNQKFSHSGVFFWISFCNENIFTKFGGYVANGFIWWTAWIKRVKTEWFGSTGWVSSRESECARVTVNERTGEPTGRQASASKYEQVRAKQAGERVQVSFSKREYVWESVSSSEFEPTGWWASASQQVDEWEGTSVRKLWRAPASVRVWVSSSKC